MSRTVRAVVVATVVTALAGAGQVLADSGAQGFIYGKVTTRSGNVYQGTIRWDGEESFWGDLFNSTKEDLDFRRYMPRDARRDDRRHPIKVFGVTIGVEWNDVDPSRQFVARFGDIDRIDITGKEDAELTMKGGSTVAVSGGSNDVDADILVRDPSLGEVELPWRKIRTIQFMQAPADTEAPAARLYGTVETRDGAFTGFIQWDSQECLSTDKLDGDSNDGRLSIDMGRIRSIERERRSASRVELRDGRSMVLDGTNDVDDSIRGIMVEDPRYGRVKVSWDAFEKAVFQEAPSSGPAYSAYGAARALRGAVVDDGGSRHEGRIVFDVDESESYEILHGYRYDVEYLIPFEMVKSVEPRSASSSLVVLRSGEELRLEDSQDVSEDNDGVLVFSSANGDPVYLEWDEVRRIEFD